jgi:small-conductance mechanosensitive channel
MLIPTHSFSSLAVLRVLSHAKRSTLFAIALTLSLITHTLAAQAPPETPPPTPYPVTLGDQTLFTILAPIGPATAEMRAAATSAHLKEVMEDESHKPEDIHTVEYPGATQIVSGDLPITTITDADADAHNTTRFLLTQVEMRAIREAIPKVRDEYSPRSIALDSLYALLATLALLLVLFLFRRLFPALYALIQRSRGTRIHGVKVQSIEIFSEERIVEVLLYLSRTLRFVLTVLLLYFYIPLVFSFFPWTRAYGRILFGYIFSPIRSGWLALVRYIPSLLVIAVIAFFAWITIRGARFLFQELGRSAITWPGFYPEWAMPTYKIVQLLIIAFAVVVAFPYLPGSDSPAFKGISIFLGVLFSLGSSSAVANVVAGIVLTYTRAFRIGDIVQISDTLGKVTEKSLLATQIRTIKNVSVTIPNSLVLGSQVINFSQSSQDKPLILHKTISIGYDSPWRDIHALLIAAASRTSGVLADPAPYVLQTSLDDSYATYQINAYTREPERMAAIYSELHQNIQDQFNEAGIEIMSPQFTALRDGNSSALPPNYRPAEYQRDTFRITSVDPAQTPPPTPPEN